MYIQAAGIDPRSMAFESEREDKLRQEWLLELARRLEFAEEDETFETFTGLPANDGLKKREWSGEVSDNDKGSPEKKLRSLHASRGSGESDIRGSAAQEACWDVLAYILDPQQCSLRTDGADASHENLLPLKAFWHSFRHLWKHGGEDSDSVETLRVLRALMVLCMKDVNEELNAGSHGSPTPSPPKPHVRGAGRLSLRDPGSAVRLLLGAVVEVVRQRQEGSTDKECHVKESERDEEETPVRRMAEIYYGRFMADQPASFTPARQAILFALMHPECWTFEDILDLAGMSDHGSRHKAHTHNNSRARLLFKSFDQCVLSCDDHEKRMVQVLSGAAKKILNKTDENSLTDEHKQEIGWRIHTCAVRYKELVRAHAPEGDSAENNFDDASIQAQKSLLFAFGNPRVFTLSSLSFLIDMNETRFWD